MLSKRSCLNMQDQNQNKGEIILYRAKDGHFAIDVRLEEDTVWLTQKQIARLFHVNTPAISKHIKNIYQEGELVERATISKMETVRREGGRAVKRTLELYNLDIIISVGYRINSRRATQFRVWATSVLRDHLIKGATFNQKRLQELGLDRFEQTVLLIKQALGKKQLNSDESLGLLNIIADYAHAWITLQKYDEGRLTPAKTKKTSKTILYEEAAKAIGELKQALINKKQTGELFGKERGSLDGILKSINQSFGGTALYPSVEAKAAHLLYFIVKDHPFVDGNKRIASLLFLTFLAKNDYLFKKNGERKLSDVALAALVLLVAQSNPKQKDTMVSLIMHFLSD